MDSQHKSPLLRPPVSLLCAVFMVFTQIGYGVDENIIWQPHPWALWSYPRLINRINAHGDEFNAVALIDGERQLVIGSERGEVLVWSLAEHRVVRRFRQQGPVHALASLSDHQEVILAGGKHAGSARSGFVRLLDVDTGTSKDFSGAGKDSMILLATDRATEVIAAASATGHIVLWATNNPAPLAAWDIREVPSSSEGQGTWSSRAERVGQPRAISFTILLLVRVFSRFPWRRSRHRTILLAAAAQQL